MQLLPLIFGGLYILNKVDIIDRHSTAYCINLNISLLRQRLDCYLKENECFEKYQLLSSDVV